MTQIYARRTRSGPAEVRACGNAYVRASGLLVRLLETENGFAFLHQVEPIARHRFQIGRIGLQQIHLARLPGEKRFLLGYLCLKLSISLRLCGQFFDCGRKRLTMTSR